MPPAWRRGHRLWNASWAWSPNYPDLLAPALGSQANQLLLPCRDVTLLWLRCVGGCGVSFRHHLFYRTARSSRILRIKSLALPCHASSSLPVSNP